MRVGFRWFVFVGCFLVFGIPLWGQSLDEEEFRACTALAITPGATVDGCAMTTHTDDSFTDIFHVCIVREKDWEPNSMRAVLKETDNDPYVQLSTPITSPGSIPQVFHTYAYINAAYPIMNEKQVAMGESTIGGRPELRNSAGWFEVVELQRIALERASTAREAIKIMGTLAEEYGYYISGEAITVVDPHEAWIFEIYGPGPLWKPGSGRPGAVWVAKRVPDGEVAVVCNRSVIGEINLNDPDNYMASSNIYTLATEMGWWDPNSGKPFKVYETYGYKAYSPYNARREWRVYSLIAPSLNLDPWLERYPFSVKPDRPLNVKDIMQINRDHYEGTEFDLTVGLAAGPFGTPNRYGTPSSKNPPGSSGWERAISLFRTNYSTVCVARSWLPDWIGGLVWFGYDAPHSTCYVPIYCGSMELPKSFATGRRGGGYDVFSRESAWWAFNFVSNYADLKFNYIVKEISAVRDPLEAEFFNLQPFIEKAAVELHAVNPELARTFLTTYTNSVANKVVDAYWKLASELVARYTDGGIYGTADKYSLQNPGYPDWWLEAVGFGLSTIPPEGCPKPLPEENEKRDP